MAPDLPGTVIPLPGLDRPPVLLVIPSCLGGGSAMLVCAVLLPALDRGAPPDAKGQRLRLVTLVAPALSRGFFAGWTIVARILVDLLRKGR